MAERPSVGRIVHFHGYGADLPRAAVVTAANEHDGHCALFVMTPTGTQHLPNVPYSAERKAGCWSWPPRVTEHLPEPHPEEPGDDGAA